MASKTQLRKLKCKKQCSREHIKTPIRRTVVIYVQSLKCVLLTLKYTFVLFKVYLICA